MKRNIRLFIEDILESIKNIESFSKGLSKDKFLKNRLKQSAIVRQIEIIGEAVKHIPNSFRGRYPEISWKEVAGIRDVIIHGYFKVDLETVWEVIKADIPDLKKKILKIKRGLEHSQKN